MSWLSHWIPTFRQAPPAGKTCLVGVCLCLTGCHSHWILLSQSPESTAIARTRAAVPAEELRHPSEFVDLTANSSGTVTSVPCAFSVEEAIEQGLCHSPDLLATRASDPVARATLNVARTYPLNPYVQIQHLPNQSFPGGVQTHYVLLMQTLQLPRKQDHREEVAAAALHATEWNIRSAELQNVATTRRLYENVVYLRELSRLARTNLDHVTQALDFHAARHADGQGSELDFRNAHWDQNLASRAHGVAEAAWQDARDQLARHLGVQREFSQNWVFDPLSQSVARVMAPPSTLAHAGLTSPGVADPSELTGYLTTLAHSRPDQQAAQCEVESSRAAWELAKANRIPDLQIGPYYQQSQSTERFYGFRAQMDIPVWNSGRPMERQRNAEYQRQLTLASAQSQRALSEVRDAWSRFERAFEDFTSHPPQSELDVIEDQLESDMKAGRITVLVANPQRNRIIQQRRMLADIQNELILAAIGFQTATGLETFQNDGMSPANLKPPPGNSAPLDPN